MNEFIMVKVLGVPLKFILAFPAVVILFFFLFRISDYDAYRVFITEDGIVEYLTSAIYLMSSLLALYISIAFMKRKRAFLGIAYAFLACGMFFIFGEEISWGQRIFNISSSQYFLENNSQRELNLHNLYPIKKLLHRIYMLVGLYGGCLWITLFKVRKQNLLINSYLIPEWYLLSYFLTVSIYYGYYDYIQPYNNLLGLTWHDEEPAELILSLGFFFFVLINAFRQIQERNLPGFQFLTIVPKSEFTKNWLRSSW